LWVQGARPKTLGAAISPVLVGTAAGSLAGPTNWARGAAALVVSLSLQVGVNYANDYSDGVRGTDMNRRGPVRLVATGLASPAAVRVAAMVAFGVAALVGGVLSLVVNPWLLLLGVAALAAAGTYTGGPKPYGYIGLGEVMVLAFFGFAATVGSAYVQHESVPGVAWFGALAVGLPACGVLLTNNLRDVDTDRVAGKQTLAVRWGAVAARRLYAGVVAGAAIAVVGAALLEPWAALALLATPLAVAPVRTVLTRSTAPELVTALVGTVRFQLALASLLAIGLWVS
jgi:1,4-dihydroxy-2-naphthoate octaprenyltransferase